MFSALVRDLEDSVAANTWRAYRGDLADYAVWLGADEAGSPDRWREPEALAAYLRTLEAGGASYATIARRLTAIHKLLEIEAIATDGAASFADPTKHPMVSVTLQAIRRRLRTDQDQASPLTAPRLIQLLVSIDTATVAGQRGIALVLIAGDPSLLPRIGYRQWRILTDAGIEDRAAVAGLHYPTAVLGTQLISQPGAALPPMSTATPRSRR